MSSQFQGVIPPVVTPRHADGSIDTASLQNLTKHLLDGDDSIFTGKFDDRPTQTPPAQTPPAPPTPPPAAPAEPATTPFDRDAT